nr:hypothetical protein [Kofleriaceae bacterium]
MFGVLLNRERQETLDLVYNALVTRDAWPDAIPVAQHLLQKNKVELREAMLDAGWLFPVDDVGTLNGHIRLRFAALCLVSDESARRDTTYVLRAIRGIGRLASRSPKSPVKRVRITEEMGDELSSHRSLLLEATLSGLGFSVVQPLDTKEPWSIPWDDCLMPLAGVEHADALLTRMFGIGAAEYQARHYGGTRASIPEVSARDESLLVDLGEVLPYAGSIQFIKDNNFAGFGFDGTRLRDLEAFHREWSDVAHQFQHPLLERARRTLRSLVGDYLSYIALWTFPINGAREHFSVPPDWEDEQPTRFRWVVDELHRMAGEIVHYHQELAALGATLVPSQPPSKRRNRRPARKAVK